MFFQHLKPILRSTLAIQVRRRLARDSRPIWIYQINKNPSRYPQYRSKSSSSQNDADNNEDAFKNEGTLKFSWGMATLVGISGVALYLGKKLLTQVSAEYCEELQVAVPGTTGEDSHSMSPCTPAQLDEEDDILVTEHDELPLYTFDDISKHNSVATGIWVSYGSGVYDITEFVDSHPGGKSKILMAAGKDIGPFWKLYTQHDDGTVRAILESYRIGNLLKGSKNCTKNDQSLVPNDPYAHAPLRHQALDVLATQPCVAETPQEMLVDKCITPSEIMFVRNHFPVPVINAETYQLSINATTNSGKPINISLRDLKSRFKLHTVTSTVHCAGNRRLKMSDHKPITGTKCGMGLVGNIQWTGVKLKDVLEWAGYTETDASHVIFKGADKDPLEGTQYETSLPVETVFDERKDILLAFGMNGKDLLPDHGYPVRLVVPGVIGARQVKWLSEIILSEDGSQSMWQVRDYKTFNPSVEYSTADWQNATPIYEYPVQSAICNLRDGDVVQQGQMVELEGFAWSGGGRGIIRVEVSTDGGDTWQNATLKGDKQTLHREWAWRLWSIEVPVPDDYEGDMDIICKAVDTANNQQPERDASIWNVRGMCANSWHKIRVRVET